MAIQLTALLARWDDLAAASAGKVEAADNPVQGGFYAGVMFGAETARDVMGHGDAPRPEGCNPHAPIMAEVLARLQSGAVQRS